MARYIPLALKSRGVGMGLSVPEKELYSIKIPIYLKLLEETLIKEEMWSLKSRSLGQAH